MREPAPLVSVIVPVYNGEAYLGEAIESIRAQTYRPVDVIVVDDGSTDSSVAVARGFLSFIRYCFQTNQGISAARNRGIALARGDFLAFLDADDVWEVDKLTRQMAAFNQDPDLDAVFGHVQEFISPDIGADQASRLRPPLRMAGYLPSAVLIRRPAFLRVGLFSTNWKTAEWVDWYARAHEQGLRITMLPETVVRRRLHSENHGIQASLARPQYAEVLKAALDRRRKVREDGRPAQDGLSGDPAGGRGEP